MTRISSLDSDHTPEPRRKLPAPKYLVLGALGLLGVIGMTQPKLVSQLQDFLNHGLAKAIGAEEIMGGQTNRNENGSSSFERIKSDESANGFNDRVKVNRP